MAIWFTSDTHFGHERIIELCDRPFSSVEEMNETMIERWNEVVHPQDWVVHLGDVSLGKIADTLPMVKRLNGRKMLTVGNHDRIFLGNKPNYVVKWEAPYREVFEQIWNQVGVFVSNDSGFAKSVLCSHFPYVGDSHDSDRFDEFRPKDEGGWLIHGHVHNAWKVNGRQINVGVDVWDFRPVSEDQIISIIKDYND
jgi:calcineurin-like phosphoesterase family protein